MNETQQRFLTYILRHGADAHGVLMQGDGFVCVDDLLQLKAFKQLDMIDFVNRSGFKRPNLFEVEMCIGKTWWIRAKKGHTLPKINTEHDCCSCSAVGLVYHFEAQREALVFRVVTAEEAAMITAVGYLVTSSERYVVFQHIDCLARATIPPGSVVLCCDLFNNKYPEIRWLVDSATFMTSGKNGFIPHDYLKVHKK